MSDSDNKSFNKDSLANTLLVALGVCLACSILVSLSAVALRPQQKANKGLDQKQPVLRARETDRGFVLDGYSPWCTGAPHAEHIVLGAEMEDGRQMTEGGIRRSTKPEDRWWRILRPG